MDSKQHSHFLYKVIIRTINFEHLIWDIIKTHFGLEPFFNNEGKIENYEDIIMFEKYFLRDFGSFSKAKIIKEITKQTIEFNKEKIEFPKRFNEKFEEFYEIRNNFAHRLFPMQIKRQTNKKIKIEDWNWENLNKRHKEIYDELVEFIRKVFFQEIDL